MYSNTNFLSMERDTSAAEAWLAEQQAQELQAGLMAYYEGRKEGEAAPQPKPWWQRAGEWVQEKVEKFVYHPPSWMSVSYPPAVIFSCRFLR